MSSGQYVSSILLLIIGLLACNLGIKKGGPKMENLTINSHNITITTTGNPEEAMMTINGNMVHLGYSAEYKAYYADHIVFGYYKDLKRLAEAIAISNPELIMHGSDMHH